MDIQAMKIEIIHWLTQLDDKSILEKIEAIKEEGYELSSDQQNMLNERLEKYKRGETKFKSWEETKSSIRSRSKDEL